ncbi:glycosyltransferase family 2 protein [Vibrio breoganii]|uniref:glycosyltransferase family 2 protein n=1 Tax=Vibrio breoganii TaxID=553239 RepID=UPI0012FFE4FD|nr:glycosyltransferase family A protein [Vibrio breoganii]
MFKISVIIPTKDRHDFLKRALDSVLSQTRSVDEIIIVDDNSHDSDYDLGFEFDKRIKLIKNTKSVGGAMSRNIGVSHSSGDIIMFLDDDDAWNSDKVDRQIRYFSNGDISLVFSGKRVVTDTNLDVVVRKIQPNIKLGDFSDLCISNFIGSTSSVAIRRNSFEKVGGFDTNLKCFQDYDLWLRLLRDKKAMYDGYTNVYYTIFKKNGMQVSRALDGRHILAGEYLLGKYEPIMDEVQRKNFKMNLYQLISKSQCHSDRIVSVKYAIKSIQTQPSIRGLKFIVAPILSLLGYKYV